MEVETHRYRGIRVSQILHWWKWPEKSVSRSALKVNSQSLGTALAWLSWKTIVYRIKGSSLLQNQGAMGLTFLRWGGSCSGFASVGWRVIRQGWAKANTVADTAATLDAACKLDRSIYLGEWRRCPSSPWSSGSDCTSTLWSWRGFERESSRRSNCIHRPQLSEWTQPSHWRCMPTC